MSTHKMEADVVVIGSGVAGAHLSRSLVNQGLDVLMLEAGAKKSRSEYLKTFYENPVKGPQSPYPSIPSAPHPTDNGYSNFYVQDKNTAKENMFIGAYLRIFGGTSWHWTGFADRLRPQDFRMKSLYGVAEDWPIDYDTLVPYYKIAEKRWGVAGDPNHTWGAPRDTGYNMPPIPATYLDKQVDKALQQMGLHSGIFSHGRNSEMYDNRPACCGNNTCVPICPIAAKYDASIDAQKAVEEGVRLEVNALVTFIEADKSGKITRVKVQRPNGETFWVKAKVFAVCCHAIETPRLLLNSKQKNAPKGIANSSDSVGRYLLTQANQDTSGLTHEPVFPYRGPQQTSGLVEHRDGKFRSHMAAIGTSFMNDGWSGNSDAIHVAKELINAGVIGSDLSNKINQEVSRHLRLNSSAEVLPNRNNRVELSKEKDSAGIPKPKITFEMDDYTKKGLKVGLDINLEILKRMGATGIKHNDPYLSNAIIGGTTRMGTDPKTSVVNADLVTHDHQNLYIIGASTHVTTPVNAPSLTISALAIRAADHIIKTLEGSS